MEVKKKVLTLSGYEMTLSELPDMYYLEVAFTKELYEHLKLMEGDPDGKLFDNMILHFKYLKENNE